MWGLCVFYNMVAFFIEWEALVAEDMACLEVEGYVEAVAVLCVFFQCLDEVEAVAVNLGAEGVEHA